MSKTYGMKKTITYSSWRWMKDRCLNPKLKVFRAYGGKGITICDRWINSFENFIEDMGERPSKEYSLDRIDGTKGYSPENCRWATRKEQIVNRSVTILFNNETASDASKRLGGCEDLVAGRVRNGWSLERAFNTPVYKVEK